MSTGRLHSYHDYVGQRSSKHMLGIGFGHSRLSNACSADTKYFQTSLGCHRPKIGWYILSKCRTREWFVGFTRCFGTIMSPELPSTIIFFSYTHIKAKHWKSLHVWGHMSMMYNLTSNLWSWYMITIYKRWKNYFMWYEYCETQPPTVHWLSSPIFPCSSSSSSRIRDISTYLHYMRF